MTRPVAVLLVPRADLRDALLGGEACGGRVPRVIGPWFAGNAPMWVPGYDDDPDPGDGIALVLAWSGRVVPGGVFRAWNVAGDHVFALCALLDRASLDDLAAHARNWTRDGRPLGEVVVIEEKPERWTCGDIPCGATSGTATDGPESCDHVPCGWSCR